MQKGGHFDIFECARRIFYVCYSCFVTISNNIQVNTTDSIYKNFSSVKMSKWHAQVAHMATHMNMVRGGALWWGPLGPPLNPAMVGTRWNGVPTSLFGVGMCSRTFLHEITLKHGCDLTDVLATRRFALLIKSLQQRCPNFFDPRSTFQVATLTRSTSPVPTSQIHTHHFHPGCSNELRNTFSCCCCRPLD